MLLVVPVTLQFPTVLKKRSNFWHTLQDKKYTELVSEYSRKVAQEKHSVSISIPFERLLYLSDHGRKAAVVVSQPAKP